MGIKLLTLRFVLDNISHVGSPHAEIKVVNKFNTICACSSAGRALPF